MKLAEILKELKTDFEIFFTRFKSRQEQLLKGIEVYDRYIMEIIHHEGEFLDPKDTAKSIEYWEALKYTIKVFYALERENEVNRAFHLMEYIHASGAFRVHIHSVGEMASEAHPDFIRRKYELALLRNQKTLDEEELKTDKEED